VRGSPTTIGMADLKFIRYPTRTTALIWQTDCIIWTTSCKAVRCIKFWNKIHGWFRSHFLL